MEIEIKKPEDQSDFPLQTEEQYKEPSPTTSQFWTEALLKVYD